VGSVLRRRGVRVVGVQAAGSDGVRRALAGEAPPNPTMTLADGLRVAVPGRLSLPLCAAVLDEIVVVDDDEILRAMASLALEDRVVAEGAGAAAVAALSRITGRRIVTIVSGGNLEPAVLARAAASAA
jgi:threonine dehydratase